MTNNEASTLWYRKPASTWAEALPIGNGRIGAMVFGGVQNERVQLNEDTLWSGEPHNYDNPSSFDSLTEVRNLISTGKYPEAQNKAESMLGVPKVQQAYQPLGDLEITFDHLDDVSDYRRELDMESGIASVSYTVSRMSYQRKIFCSFPDNVLVMQVSGIDGARFSFDLSLTSLHSVRCECSDEKTLSMVGKVGPREEARLIASYDGEGLTFEARAMVRQDGGSIVQDSTQLSVKDATTATIILSAATSFVRYDDISDSPARKNDEVLSATASRGIDDLLSNHVRDFQSLFGRMAIDLPDTAGSELSTRERLDRVASGGDDPFLAGQVFQFGRYLLISSSRPGSEAANLQGIWNEAKDPPWGSKYTININIQMNYWQAEVCNLSECTEPLFRMIEELAETGTQTASVHYRADGWLAHHNTDIWRGAAPVDGATWGMWPMGGAWLCQHIWEHYLFHGSHDFLDEIYPIIRRAAEFFLSFLIENDQGMLITSPSISPEHAHKGGMASGRDGSTICAAPTMDMELLRDLFTNCAEASRVLGCDADFRGRVTDACNRLVPLSVGRHGQLQEWQDDWDNPQDTHGHVSHLYGLYPSTQINPQDTPKLAEAAKISLMHRGPHGGWPGAWQISLWARLGDGDRARSILMEHLIPGFTTNLFNGRRVYQIDGNMGATAGISELLLQSHLGCLHLLPALPSAWHTGTIRGLRGRGGFEVSLKWKNGSLETAEIRSNLGRSCTICYQDKTCTFDTDRGTPTMLNRNLDICDTPGL